MALGLNYQPNEKAPATPVNKPTANIVPKLKNNRLTVGAIIVIVAVYIVIYVGNGVKVKSLLKDQQRIKSDYDSLLDYSQTLRAKIVGLQSADRITKVAGERLNMVQAQHAPEKLK